MVLASLTNLSASNATLNGGFRGLESILCLVSLQTCTNDIFNKGCPFFRAANIFKL